MIRMAEPHLLCFLRLGGREGGLWGGEEVIPSISEYEDIRRRYLSSVRPYARYQAYKGAYTKGEAFALGAHPTDLGWDHQDGFRFLLVSAALTHRVATT